MENVITIETRGDNEVAVCGDCGRWEYLGKNIRHSSRCDYPQAQRQIAETQSVPTVHPRMDANGKLSDELLAGVRKGYLTMSDAMNTDF